MIEWRIIKVRNATPEFSKIWSSCDTDIHWHWQTDLYWGQTQIRSLDHGPDSETLIINVFTSFGAPGLCRSSSVNFEIFSKRSEVSYCKPWIHTVDMAVFRISMSHVSATGFCKRFGRGHLTGGLWQVETFERDPRGSRSSRRSAADLQTVGRGARDDVAIPVGSSSAHLQISRTKSGIVSHIFFMKGMVFMLEIKVGLTGET